MFYDVYRIRENIINEELLHTGYSDIRYYANNNELLELLLSNYFHVRLDICNLVDINCVEKT